MRRQHGFTYVMVLWWVAISGVMLMALSERWSMEMRRQKDAELAFRGEQIRLAIEAYAKVPVADGELNLPARLEDLLADNRSGKLVRHLRQVWPDPITGKEWGLVMQGRGIRGVFSKSKLTPITGPNGVGRYEEWQFLASGP